MAPKIFNCSQVIGIDFFLFRKYFSRFGIQFCLLLDQNYLAIFFLNKIIILMPLIIRVILSGSSDVFG